MPWVSGPLGSLFTTGFPPFWNVFVNPAILYPTRSSGGAIMRRSCWRSRARRLRMVSQAISGRPRVTVRAYYEGLPSMAGRGTDESGESRRIMGEGALSSPRKYGPEAQNRRAWSAERRRAAQEVSQTPCLCAPSAELARCGKSCGGIAYRAFRRSAPSHQGARGSRPPHRALRDPRVEMIARGRSRVV